MENFVRERSAKNGVKKHANLAFVIWMVFYYMYSTYYIITFVAEDSDHQN